MRIACLVKFVPNVDNFIYDYEKNVIVRENSQMIINPDDTAALAYALKLRDAESGSRLEVISMAPSSVLPLVRDILRVGADRFLLLADKMFIGSDTYATAVTLSKFIKAQNYDVILSGSSSLDSGTSHIPPQISEITGIGQISGISKILEVDFVKKSAVAEVEGEAKIHTYETDLPAILSLSKQSGYKMPFVRYEDINSDVDDRIRIISGQELGLTAEETGLAGSKTTVKKTYSPYDFGRKAIVVKADDDGADTVYHFLVDKGYLDG